MLLPILVLLACFFAAVLQWAAIRSPDTSSQPILLTARRINSVGLGVAGAYILYSLIEYGTAHAVLCLVAGLYALSQVLFAVHTFFEPSCTIRLMEKPSSKKESTHEASLT